MIVTPNSTLINPPTWLVVIRNTMMWQIPQIRGTLVEIDDGFALNFPPEALDARARRCVVREDAVAEDLDGVVVANAVDDRLDRLTIGHESWLADLLVTTAVGVDTNFSLTVDVALEVVEEGKGR